MWEKERHRDCWVATSNIKQQAFGLKESAHVLHYLFVFVFPTTVLLFVSGSVSWVCVSSSAMTAGVFIFIHSFFVLSSSFYFFFEWERSHEWKKKMNALARSGRSRWNNKCLLWRWRGWSGGCHIAICDTQKEEYYQEEGQEKKSLFVLIIVCRAGAVITKRELERTGESCRCLIGVRESTVKEKGGNHVCCESMIGGT